MFVLFFIIKKKITKVVKNRFTGDNTEATTATASIEETTEEETTTQATTIELTTEPGTK